MVFREWSFIILSINHVRYATWLLSEMEKRGEIFKISSETSWQVGIKIWLNDPCVRCLLQCAIGIQPISLFCRLVVVTIIGYEMTIQILARVW